MQLNAQSYDPRQKEFVECTLETRPRSRLFLALYRIREEKQELLAISRSGGMAWVPRWRAKD